MDVAKERVFALQEISAETSKTENRTKTEKNKSRAEYPRTVGHVHIVYVLVRGTPGGILELFKGTEELFETMLENFPQINVRHETTGPEVEGTSPKTPTPGHIIFKGGQPRENSNDYGGY